MREPVSRHPGAARGARFRSILTGLLVLGLSAACVTPAEHRKLQRKVVALQSGGDAAGPGTPLADLSADVQSLRSEIASLRGRVEVAEKQASDALRQATLVRKEMAKTQSEASQPQAEAAEEPRVPEALPSKEVQAYREALAAGRAGETDVCIDRFRSFLQNYPSSRYADDAAYWMADCHFQKKDYRTAVLRFDDVVRKYPDGNKAPDALYRQGESLLKLGPGFNEAARRAFERVVKEYPNSARAPEASRQIERIPVG